MECIYCGAGEENLQTTDFLDYSGSPFVGIKFKSDKYPDGRPCREYFCLNCQQYFFWMEGAGFFENLGRLDKFP